MQIQDLNRLKRCDSSPSQGTIGFEAQIDKCLELSEYLYNKIKDREGYEMIFNGKVRPRLILPSSSLRSSLLLPPRPVQLHDGRLDWHTALLLLCVG